MMRRNTRPGNPAGWAFGLIAALVVFAAWPAGAAVFVQEPPDVDGVDTNSDGDPNNDNVYMHLAAGDGFVNMADGKLMYCFGFSDVTGTYDEMAMMQGMLAAEFPGPTIELREGDRFYLSLTNVGMMMRPDLFDPHTVHWHGFPEAASIFDGVPEASVSINMGSTFTYFYKVVEPGTYIYHCHVEATEHMQMGMLANLYVYPIQDMLPNNTPLGGGWVHHTGDAYAYNDGDGSTYYDVDYAIQLGSFDPDFHDASLSVQPLPFAMMRDRYAMLNGRGYPDTIVEAPLANSETGHLSQKLHSKITAAQGETILLRLSNLSVTEYFTVTALGIPMKVIGTGARQLRGPGGEDTGYWTTSVTLGGGETADVLLDTTDVEPGTYLFYTTNLKFLSNDQEDYGGMMTEIEITEP
ncbi:MAG: multicopper oxidase domain-containing protein [Verrucomicrobia bacterium]|nr:multicopper oxidase domain-containing protein [Verrucomicrobiota bacterium]